MRKKHEIDEKDDSELWFISLAELMSLLMVFFVLLYSMSSIDTKKFQEMSSSISSKFVKKEKEEIQADATPESAKDEAARQQRAFQMLVSLLNLNTDIGDSIDKVEEMYASQKESDKIEDHVKNAVKQIEGLKASVKSDEQNKNNIILQLIYQNSDVFDTKNNIKPSATEGFQEFIISTKQLISKVEIEILNYTDSRNPNADSGFTTNWEVSTERALRIAKVLTNLGIAGEKISVKGMGSKSPLLPEFDDNHKPLYENMKRNNRTHILLKKPMNEGKDF